MQSVHSRDKITVLILLAASTVVGVLGSDVTTVAEAPEAGHGANRLLIAAALAGSLIAVMMLLSPGKTHRSLRATLRDIWIELIGLAALVVAYALVLEPLGFFVATSLFLAAGNFLLGERQWWSLLMLSVPVAIALQLILHGIFGFPLTGPFMDMLAPIA